MALIARENELKSVCALLAPPRIGLGDYLIAATALIEGLELATLNVRHYPMFPGLARPF